MRRLVYLFIALFFCISSYSQEKYTLEEGKITQYEATMTEYELDKDAEAVVLYELGEYRFRGDDITGTFLLYMDKRTKIKILKQAGLEYANINIPYYQSDSRSFEEVDIRSAVTVNYEDGKVIRTELDKKNIFKEKINENWFRLKFSMPNVKEGSIIEINYEIVSPFIFNMHDWDFQYKIPVVYSKLNLRMIPYYEYAYIMRGSSKFDEYSTEMLFKETIWRRLKYKEMQVIMGRKDVPAFRDEEFITSPNDYMNKIVFQLSKVHNPYGGKRDIMTTWPAMCKDFLKEDGFGKFISVAEKAAKKIIPSLPLEGKSSNDKIKIVTQYVKENYNWNGINTKFAREKADKVMKAKSGNSAELNFLLLAFLRAAGINAQPVVLSTREHGKIASDYPFQTYFNYVLVLVEEENNQLYLDATMPLLAYNELPERCINVTGLVVAKDAEKWVEISQDELAYTEKEFTVRFCDDLQTQKTNVHYASFAYDAFHYRKVYYGEDKNLKEFLEKRDIKSVENLRVEHYDDSEKPFNFSFDTETEVNNVSGKLFIAPFLTLAPQNNIFKQTSRRTLPIDMVLRDGGVYKAYIEIPKGYKVESAPKDYNSDGRIVSLHYKTEIRNDAIIVEADYSFKKSIYEAKEYNALQQTYNEIIRIFNTMIVLVKSE